MTDLTALDAANKAVQADRFAAKTVKAFAAAASTAIHSLAAQPQPTPPPVPSPLLDDMRAIHMKSLSSHLVHLGLPDTCVDPAGNPLPGWSVQAAQDPAGFWTEQICRNDDVSLIPDSRFGQVYRHRTNGASSNPYWGSPTTCNASLVQDAYLSMGQWDWFADAVKLEPGWDHVHTTDFHVLFQFGYPTITSPPLSLSAGWGDRFFLERNGGPVTQTSAGWRAAEFDTYDLCKMSDRWGQWVDFVVGVRWGSHNDGAIQGYVRCKGLGETQFTKVVDRSGINTWQWGGALNVPQDAQNFGICHKQDNYWGYQAGLTDSNITSYTYVDHSGYVRDASKDAVLATLP